VNDSEDCHPWNYDPLNRPVEWENGKGERFEYDPTNQLKKVSYDAQSVWTGVPQNAMNTVNGATYNYDGNFNLVSAPNWSGTYDAQSRLVSASHDGNVVFLTYDGLGRCVRRIAYRPDGSSTTRLITYDGWKPMLEWDGGGNFLAWNVYGAGPDEILVRGDSTYGTLIYKQDHHGNVVGLLDGGGNVIERYRYDAFGKPTIFSANNTQLSTSAYGNRFMFQGREWIPELGIYDYRHRMYQPELGRFLQMDPTGFDAGDMDLFRYCGDDPVDRSDPTGLVDRDVNASIWNRLRLFDNASTDAGSLYELDHPQQPTGVIVHWDITNTIRLVRNVTKRDEGKSKGVSRRISAG